MNRELCAAIAATVLLSGALHGQGGPAPDLARQVFVAESSFAATMTRRDYKAFGEFLAQETVFFGRTTMRGKAAVLDGWQRYFAEAEAPFSWRPETVEVLPSGTLALTSGPVYDREGKLTNTFTSIWRLEPDGRWRVIFDKGCPIED